MGKEITRLAGRSPTLARSARSTPAPARPDNCTPSNAGRLHDGHRVDEHELDLLVGADDEDVSHGLVLGPGCARLALPMCLLAASGTPGQRQHHQRIMPGLSPTAVQ